MVRQRALTKATYTSEAYELVKRKRHVFRMRASSCAVWVRWFSWSVSALASARSGVLVSSVYAASNAPPSTEPSVTAAEGDMCKMPCAASAPTISAFCSARRGGKQRTVAAGPGAGGSP